MPISATKLFRVLGSVKTECGQLNVEACRNDIFDVPVTSSRSQIIFVSKAVAVPLPRVAAWINSAPILQQECAVVLY